MVGTQIVDKAGTMISHGQRGNQRRLAFRRTTFLVVLSVEQTKFVSRAGYKLDAAIQHFGIDVKDKYCFDAGIGTGGFTDCLLQRGALKVQELERKVQMRF